MVNIINYHQKYFSGKLFPKIWIIIELLRKNLRIPGEICVETLLLKGASLMHWLRQEFKKFSNKLFRLEISF